ncbi:head GIN domain-containing protein [Mucilaginibacter ginsenosidivorax]|uniref:DUF2807 domain-containing protein n=1 Tax=Mucilaginibacter ginsenosidivorax TaxID=862126 RepID=A0A5B8VX32_9SPHI|nr:head GIN domain-containing protein [Mucilaginibacter ginsenosidivorax]QEC75989.1 DUF2807 domain-containing protein [Mucilaginibacter ginsenosidivorax]
MKTLSKILLIAALITGTAGYTIAKTNTPTDEVTQNTEDRHLSGFTSVSVAGSFDVVITQGATESVKVQAPSDVISRIITEVEGNTLKIYTKSDNDWHWFDGGHKKVMIYVSIKEVNGVSLSGSGDVSFREGLRAGSFRLKLTGSGDVSGKLWVKNLDVNLAGSGDIKISGTADNSNISVAGSGDYTARDLTTNTASVRVAGSGDARVNVSQKLEASVVGSGDVYYTGSVKSVSSSKIGSGDVSRM